MSRTDWGLAVFAVIVLGIVVYGIVGLATPAAQISAALIGVAGVVVGSVIRYSAELERNRVQNLRLVKQQNYQKLLEKIGGYVRDKDKGSDPLTIAHIESWVFGDSEVVKATYLFMDNPNQENLKDLLHTMRRSIGLPDLEFEADGIWQLFPERRQSGLPE